MADRLTLRTRLQAIAVASLYLVACETSAPPPPVVDQDPSVTAATLPSVTTSAAADTRVYTVVPGDGIVGVAARLGVPVRALIDLNALPSPYLLQPGQRLLVPGRADITALPRGAVEVRQLQPTGNAVVSTSATAFGLRYHVVESGDTVYNISRRYGVDRVSLVNLNNISPPYTIRIGQRLELPGGAVAPGAFSGNPAIPAPMVAPAPIVASTATDPLSATVPPTGAPVPLVPTVGAPAPPGDSGNPVDLAAPSSPATPEVAAQSTPDGRFLWPVNGKVVARFGSRDGGLHNDGINIAAPRGTPVRATDTGVVVYAGNELRGFGNLLLIRHADGWVSAYAHNESLLVQRGDNVDRGQTIARVGNSGNVTSSQLHFELRRGTQAVDPLTQLSAQGA